MTFEHILYSVQDSLATLILNRPDSANTLSLELIREVQEVLKELSSREDVSALVIKGAGKHFSSGHLLKELVDGDPSYYRTVFTCCGNMMEALHALPMPVIASVRGAAFAAGCQLVATCDLVVAEEGARFATPGVKIGLFCTTPMIPLTRCVGRKIALDMLMTGRILSAAEALQYGLVSRVTSNEQLDEVTLDMARTIAGYSRHVVRSGKAAFYRQIEMDEDRALDYAREIIAFDLLNQDAFEGIGAFLEKRDPVWKHK